MFYTGIHRCCEEEYSENCSVRNETREDPPRWAAPPDDARSEVAGNKCTGHWGIHDDGEQSLVGVGISIWLREDDGTEIDDRQHAKVPGQPSAIANGIGSTIERGLRLGAGGWGGAPNEACVTPVPFSGSTRPIDP